MASFNFHPHYAEVFLSGDLTAESASDLIDTVDLMVGAYFYRRVVIVIDSSGGLVEALARVLAAQRRWRDSGVQICTRVDQHAHSAAALIVSLGDDRVADAQAELLYHHVTARNLGPLTSQGAATVRANLEIFDDRALESLVDRALDGVPERAPLIARAEESDRAVLGQLVLRIFPTGWRRRRGVRRLARLVGRVARRALRARDREALAGLYRHLFALDTAISGSLAYTLRLVDRVDGDEPELATASPGSPGLTIPEWRSLYQPSGEVSRETLVRHALVLGQTGAGKSRSVILPFVRALAQAPREQVSASLIIDPSHEIGPLLERWAPDRLKRLAPADVGLNVMSGRWSLDGDLAECRWRRAAHKILLRTVEFVPTSLARVLTSTAPDGLNGQFFAREGTELLLTVLAFVLMVTHCDVPPPEKWLAGDNSARAWVQSLRDRAQGVDGKRGPNAVALASYALEGPLVAPPMPTPSVFDDPPVPSENRWLFARIAERAQSMWREGEGRDVLDRVLHYWQPMVNIQAQYAGVLASARATCSEMAASGIATTLYFGCEPCARDAGIGSLDFTRAVGVPCDGRVLLFQPARDRLDTLVTRALKALFFEAVFNDVDRASGAPVPLIGYVCDEFHRIVTSDWTHGESAFLDACRSYGVACVLACQSMASIEHALAQRGGTETQHRAAASTLWTNTGTKIVFRTSDPQTARRVDDLCPYRPGLAPITQVRPLSTLAPGECYASLPDGRFERRQLDPVVVDGIGCAQSVRAGALATSPQEPSND